MREYTLAVVFVTIAIVALGFLCLHVNSVGSDAPIREALAWWPLGLVAVVATMVAVLLLMTL